jgi:ubiquinone biosynthesis accessory factor UbiK
MRTDLVQSWGLSALSECDYGGTSMNFFNSTGLDDLARRLADSVPESLRAFGRDLEGNFKAVLQAQFSKLDLVTRQEFDVQAAILERTRSKLAELESRLKELEARVSPQ